jgi:HAE1 family hydrophobic/amphiphilic exporter-1
VNLSELFIKRPVTTTLVMLSVALFGVLAYLRLPVSALPSVEFPTINVSANLPGASAETMAASVATPLEREFSAIDGLDSMTSSSSLGSTQLTLQFDTDRDLDAAAADVQASIARASGRLPRDMPAPPNYRKVNPAEQPIIFLSLSSAVLPLHQVNEFAETHLAPQISTLTGVAQVNIYGSQKYAVRVQVDPDKLATLGIGIDEVERAIQDANVNNPTGRLNGPTKAFTIETNGQLVDAKAYQSIVVAYRNGVPVRLSELGLVVDSVENDKTAAWTVDERSIVLAVQKQPGANTVQVARAVRELMPQFRESLPSAVTMGLLFDKSESVEHSVRDVQFTLLLTLALVVMVIFLFLRRLTATIIPSLAMPLSILGTFSVMYLLGYSLDNLSLMALTLSVGFVVDDAIVVLENIVRHLEHGKSPMQAALDGAREVGFTIVSMTLSLVAVFLPFLFLGGILGGLFREFAVTIAVAILISGFVSLTLTPMMSARMLKSDSLSSSSLIARFSESVLHGSLNLYDRTLRFVLRQRAATLVFSVGILVATGLMYQRLPKGFLPTQDEGQIFVMTEAIEGVSYEAVRGHQQQINEVVKRNPNVVTFMSSVGPRGTLGASNTGFLFIRIKPQSEREATINDVVAQLRSELASVPGMRAFPQVPPQVRIGGSLTKSEYQLLLQSSDLEGLYESVPKLTDALAKLPALRDVTTDLQLKNAILMIDIDRDQAASLGVSAAQVESALYSSFGGRFVSSIYAPQNTYQVVLEMDPKKQQDASALQKLYIRSNSGSLVPLPAIAKISEGVGPLSVNHAGQLPAVTVSFNLKPGFGLSEAVAQVEDTASKVLPSGVSTRFQGAAQAFADSLGGLGLLLAVSIFIIYVVLGMLYESFIHPLTILSALPFAGFGALATLMIFGVELNVYAFVGVILLVGLVKKNGIMMVDFAIEQRRDGASAEEAIHKACLVRFRPIMMTTMAALLGTLPIALGIGAGAEARQPLGLAVVGGLLFSQLLTLYVTPVFYVVLEKLRSRGRNPVPAPATVTV